MNRIVFLLLFPFFLHISQVQAAGEPTRILMLGDSLTEGLGVAPEQAYPVLVEKLLRERGKKVEVINGGVSGDTSAGGLSRLKWLLKKKPQYLFLALGANDGLRGVKPESTKKNLEAIIKEAKASEVKVLLAGMQMPMNFGKEYRQKFQAVFPALAKEHKLALMPFLLEGVATQGKYNQADKIHPNEAGHKIMAKNVADFLENKL